MARKTTAADVDALLDTVGPVGRYEVLQLSVWSLGLVACAFQLFSIVFVGQDVVFSCAAPSTVSAESRSHLNISALSYNPHTSFPASSLLEAASLVNWTQTSVFHGRCRIFTSEISENGNTTSSQPCPHGYSYALPKDSSLTSEFDLVCEKAPLVGLTQTLLTIGQVVGSFILPAMADRWGRKRMHVIAHVLIAASGIGLAFSPNFVLFAVMKVVVGVGQIGARLTNMTATVEVFPVRHRARVSAVFNGIIWAVFMALIAPVAYGLRFQSWRVLQLVFTASSLLGLIQLLILDEPLRWLLANNKQKQALAVVTKAASLNKRNVQELQRQAQSLITASGLADKELKRLREKDPDDKSGYSLKEEMTSGAREGRNSSTKRISALDIIKHRRMRAHVFMACVLWFVNTLTYFALSLTTSSLAGDRYVNFALVAIVEIPSCIAYSFTLDRYGRKPTLMVFHILAGLGLMSSSICLAFSDNQSIATLSTVLSMIGKFAVTGSLNVTFAYTAELFPTNCRNLSLGAASSAGRIGGMLAPFAGILSQYVIWAPGCVFGTLCLLLGFLTFLFPETKGKPLPQTIEDLEQWYTIRDRISADKDSHSESEC